MFGEIKKMEQADRLKIQNAVFSTPIPEAEVVEFAEKYGIDDALVIVSKVMANEKYQKGALWRQLARRYRISRTKTDQFERERKRMVAEREASDPNFDPRDPECLRKALEKYYQEGNCSYKEYQLGLDHIGTVQRMLEPVLALVEEEVPF